MSVAPVATVVSGNTYTLDPRYDLSNSRILGKGSFGVVCTALDTVRNMNLAIKRIRPYANDEWDAKHTLREVRLMRLLGNHPNVITLYELSLFLPKTELYMMIEEMDSDLHRVIQSNKPLTPRHHKCFLKQLLEGIKAMHAVGVLHRDLKPGNILVSKDCQLRITDFGLARFMDDQTRKGENKLGPMTQYVVTRWYRPPELLLAPNLPYGEAVDLWSIGCILAEMTKRKAIFPGKDHLNQVDLIFNALGYQDEEQLGFPIDEDSALVLKRMSKLPKQPLSNYVPTATPEALDLMETLLTINPKHRPSAEQALQHPFLADAEVLHDYSKTYLTRPTPDYFEFEHTAFTVPELRSLIHKEVNELSAEAYHTPASTTSHEAPSSPEVPLGVSSGQKPIRRRSEAEEEESAETIRNQLAAGHSHDSHAEGPPSQLPTVRLQNGEGGPAVRSMHNDSIYLANNKNSNNKSIAPAGSAPVPVVSGSVGAPAEKKGKDNPFRSHAAPAPVLTSSATAPSLSTTTSLDKSSDTTNTSNLQQERSSEAQAMAGHNPETLVAAVSDNDARSNGVASTNVDNKESQACCTIS